MGEVAADIFPLQQALLVELVRSIRQQKVIDPTIRNQLFYHLIYNPGYRLGLWTDLPLLSINAR